MADIKTKATKRNVKDFINSVENERRRNDGFTLLELFTKITGEKPVLWGNTTSSFVGFGKYHYKSEKSSQEGYWPLTGFSPRKQNLALYPMMTGLDNNKGMLAKLGKHKSSMGCVYINKLDDVDMKVLEEFIKKCYLDMKKKHSQEAL